MADNRPGMPTAIPAGATIPNGGSPTLVTQAGAKSLRNNTTTPTPTTSTPTTSTTTPNPTPTQQTVSVPNKPMSDQIIERCVALASWGHNITSSGRDCKSTKERRAQMTRYSHLVSHVSHDVNVITPQESVVMSSPSSTDNNLADNVFVTTDAYKKCTAVHRVFTPSIRGASEICDAIAHAQYNSFHLYNSRKMAPAFLAGCSSGIAFGSKKEKKLALKLCFSDSSRIDNLIKDFESLRNNAFEGFVRALEEKSPVNVAMSAWVCGKASADMILLRKNKLKHGPLKKASAAGLFTNDGTAAAYAAPSDYLSEISKRSKNTEMTFDTATRVFDVAIKRILSGFIEKTKTGATTTEDLGIYLRQTRIESAVGAEVERIDCPGILTPRNPAFLKNEQEKRSNYPTYFKAATLFDEEINEIGKRRKRKASEDLDRTMAKDIIGSSPSVNGGITDQAEWSMHITQLVAEAFLETMSSLLACSFGVVDPLSEKGMVAIKNILVKNIGDLNSKRVEENAASAAIDYFVKIGNFSIPFVASDPHDVVEGRRVSPNTPIIFIVNKKEDPDNSSKINTIFSLRDRLLVKDDFMSKALQESKDDDKAATYIGVRTPTVGGSLPIIRGPFSTDADTNSTSIKETKEGISIDWYVNLSNMCSTGKTTAAVASGISRALASVNAKSSKTPSKRPEERKMLESLRRNVDRSKNLLYAMGQNLSSWGYEEHNATINSYWSSVSSARSFAIQEAMNRGNDVGVRYQFDKGCVRDSFVDAESHMRVSFFDAVDRPGDSILHLGDVISSLSSNSSSASWRRFVDAMGTLPSAARRVFNIKELLNAASGFKSAFGPASNRRRKDVLKNVGAAVKLIKGLVEMSLQNAFNVASLEEAGSVADGWAFNNQFEPSRMKAIEDLSGSRNRRDVVTVMLNQECGSVKFSDKRRRGSNHKRTDVLVIPLVILEHLVADKVVLDSVASASNRSLASILENFIDILSGKDTKVFNDHNKFMTLVRYIWFNMAILSLTDSNIISAINMARRDLGDSIYSDYLAIRSLVNQYGDGASKYSIGKIIESYSGDGKKAPLSSCADASKITSEDTLNAVLKKLTSATEAFSIEKEANNGVKVIPDVGTVNDTTVEVNVNDVIGEEGKTKLVGFLKMLKSAVQTSTDLNLVLKQASVANAVPDQTQDIIKELGAEGPAKNKPLEGNQEIIINLNPVLKDSMVTGIRRLLGRLGKESEKNASYIIALTGDIADLTEGDCERLKTKYFIPKGVTPKAAASVITALNENYPHSDLLLKAIEAFSTEFTVIDSSVTVKMSAMKNFLKNGLIVSLACLTNPRGLDFNLCGADLLSKILAHFSAEASLTLSRIQKTFAPIHPGLLALHDTIKPSKVEFEIMTEDFIKSVIEKIEEDSAPLLSRCDDSRMSKGLADAGVNYNDSVGDSSSSTMSEHTKNPTDLWNKYALAHFDTAIVPKFADTSRLSNTDLVKLSAYWQGMSKLPYNAEPYKWRTSLVGVEFDLSKIPGMSNVCTFNSALDTMLANPENSCGLISREITRNSAKLAHDIGSTDTIADMGKILKTGHTIVLPKSHGAGSSNDQQPFDIFKYSASERCETATSSLGIISERYCDNQTTASSSENDLVNTTIRSLPSFRQNIVDATRSLFEAAAVCNLLSLNANAKVASKKIINIIKTQSNVTGEIGISRIAGLVSSVTTYKQYRNFLAFVDEKRRTLMRKAALNYNNSCGLNATDSMYVTLAAINPSYPGKMEHLPDRFWIEVFEDCEGFVEEDTTPKVFTSKLNSYAAVASKVDRTSGLTLKSEIEARRNQVTSKMGELEAFVIEAARTDLKEDKDVALSNLMKAQRLLSRMNMAIEARRNDSVVFLSNRGKVPTVVNVIDGVFSEITTGPEGKDGGALFLASKMLVAKEIFKRSSTQEAIEMTLAAAGVDSHAFKLADIICQRMKAEDISLFMGGTMFQRGLFTTFLLNDILARQISPELMTKDLGEDTKKQLVNLVEFCTKIKRALITMRNNKGRSIRRYNNAKKNNKTITDDMRADWAFANSVYSAFKTLRNNTSFETRTSNLIDMLGTGAFGGSPNVTRPKRKSTLNDVLEAGTTLNRSFFSNYCEKTAASKVVRTSNIRMYRALKMRNNQNPGLLACFDSGKLFSNSVEEGIHSTGGMSRFCQDEDYDMLLDEYDEDTMDLSSESSSESEGDTSDWSSSDSECDYDDDVSARKRDALETLDSLAVPLGKLYACGEGHDDDFNNAFDTNLGRLVGRIDSDDDSESDDESDEEVLPRAGSTRRANKIVYGAGFLSSGPSPIYDNPRKLGEFLRGKKAKYDTSSSSDHTSDSAIGLLTPADRLKRRAKRDQMSFMKRGLRQFMPKDITIDENDEITVVEYMSQDKARGFLLSYGASGPKDRKYMREEMNISTYAPSNDTRTQRINFRRNLVKTAAAIVKTLKENRDMIYSAMFANLADADITPGNVASKLLFEGKLKSIVDERNNFIKNASAAASTLFSCEDSHAAISSPAFDKGYLTTPIEKLALCLRKSTTNTDNMSVKDVLADKSKTHLDWLNTVSTVFARSFNVTTGYALDEVFKVTKVLKSMYDSFESVIDSAEGAKEDVKSSLLSNIFNTRMVHTNAIMGLFLPTAFLNYQIMGKNQLESNEIEMELLTLVRGINSRQLTTTDLGGSTDILLSRLMSPRVSGPAGSRGGLSLFRMSLTDTVMGKGLPNEGGRVKGAVSLEVRSGGPDGGITIEDHIFAKKCKDLVKFCKDQSILVGKASGPLYRFATGFRDIKTELDLPFTPYEGEVADDILANRLIASETDEKRGDFMRLSAHGNLYGCFDIISRLARKTIETQKVVSEMLDDNKGDTKTRVKSLLEALRSKRVKALKANKRSIIQNNAVPSFSDNVLLKSREFLASVATLTNEVTKRLSLEFNKFSLKSFERILENSAVLANTKSTLRNLENRLQAAVVELGQFKHIRDNGLTTPRRVIDTVANRLCTLTPDNEEDWMLNDAFIKFAVDSELFNLKEAKMNISRALRGVHIQHMTLLNMINTAISTDDSSGSGNNSSSTATKKKKNQMELSTCGKYVIHPSTGLLVKIEEGDITGSCDDGIESIHRQVALKVLERIDRNRNNLIRNKLYAMRTGRGDLRAIVSFDNEDMVKTDSLVKALGTALANAVTATDSITPQQYHQQQQQQQSVVKNAFNGSVLPIRKAMSYIPVALENKHSPSTSCADTGSAPSSVSLLSDGNQDTTYRFMDQQEAHDLATILNVRSKHMGDYNQASLVALFNRSHKARANISLGNEKASASPSKQLFENISQTTAALTAPPSATNKGGNGKRVSDYVSKIAYSLSDTPEYAEMSKIYDDMASALSVSSSVGSRQFITNPSQEGHYPKTDYDTIKVLSEMIQLKTTAIERYVKLLSSLNDYSNDPSMASSLRPSSSPIVSTIETGAIDSSVVRNISPDTASSSSSTVDMMGRIEAAFQGGSPREVINRETDIRRTLLMHYNPFLSKIQNMLKMITDYFANIEKIRDVVKEEVNRISADQLKKVEKSLKASEQDAVPVYERGVEMHKEEVNAINTEISVLRTKIVELDSTHNEYVATLESLTNKFSTGTNEVPVDDLMSVSDSSQRQSRMIEDLSDFAKKHAGVVYNPETEEASKSENMKTIKADIARGQDRVLVSYAEVLSKFPNTLKDEMKSVEDIKIFMSNLRLATTAVEGYTFVLRDRIRLLEDRASTSSADAASIEERIGSSKVLLQNQLVEQRIAIDRCTSLSTSAINHTLVGEVVKYEAFNFIDIQVERLLANAKRGDTPATVNETAAPGEEGSTINTVSSAEKIDRLAADVEGNSFACQLKPLHDVIDRMMDVYRRKGTSIVSSKVDLQLASIFDMSMAVLGKTSRPEQKPSDIVPGLCRLCSMMITNLHEETHTSDHAFEFDALRSTETLRRILSAVISKDSDNANVRYDTLSMLESHNGYVKDLKFKKKQNVACLTPINTLLGAYDNMTIQPGTVLLPSSELFACDGLDHDKFRSMIHRSSDPSLADSSKSADSIMEMYASSDPNAEMLFFTNKDERRFFNSIPDCIIENMSDSASSVYNTYCSQSAVREDPKTGIPVFVGRLNRPSTAATTKPAKSASGNGGVPTHCTGTVNMGARYMVAPGSTLNAKKEEMMRLSRVSDINNVMYCDLDVNVSGSNNAWRIGEIVKAACGGNDMLMEKARKMLLLGSVTTLAQQKASTRVNDPTTLLQTNSVVEQYVAGESVSAEDLIVRMSYQQRFFPDICNHSSRFVGNMSATNSGGVCPGDLLGDYKRFKTALNRHDNSCGVFLNSLSGVPTSSTQQGILDTVVQSQPIREKNTLAVGAMTDSTVDMVSAVSSGAWKNANLFMPNTALTGKPITRERTDELKRALAGVVSNAHKLDRMGGVGGITSLSAVFGGARGSVGFATISEGNNESERLFNMILGNAASSSPSSLATKEDIANNRSLVSSILDISDKEMTDMVRTIEDSIDKSRLEKAIGEIKRNILITSSSSPITSSRASPSLSAILKASDVRQGRLSSSVMESGEDAVRAVDSFKTSPLLVRHTALFHPFSPLSLSSQTRDMLARRTKSTTTANNLLSESMPILSDVFLCNTRDTPAERALDRMLLIAYITKQAKHFDDVCSSVPVALTGIAHNTMSAIDHKSSRLISNLKLHVNDTTSIFRNIERFEKLSGRYGDEYAMSNRQNCNCPFELHHDFRPSADESLVRSFAYARPEVTVDEIRDTPYLCHRTLSNKHFIMDATKVDPRVSGASLYRKVSAWADMHNNVSYTGAFEPSRMALANSNFSTAGVNLDVIVRPNNASGVLGVLSCHRKHLCIADLKVSVASSMPSVFNDFNRENTTSELIQNALPHNKYIQKSRLNASSIIFSNVLDKLIKDLGMDISEGLSYKLLNGEYSVPETVLDETDTIMNKLMSSVTVSGTKMSSSSEETSSGKGATEAAMLTGDIASNYTRNALKEAVSEELKGSAESVPFSSAADGSMAFDFLMSKDRESGAVGGSNGVDSSPDKSLITVLFEAVANKIGDKDFGRILDGIDAKINDFKTTDSLNNMPSEEKNKWLNGRQELRRLLSFLRILKDNITPSLTTGKLGEDVKLYISLISAKSRFENVLRYGLSNSSSVDLSHLKPLNPTAVSKNIEDTFTYRNVPPIFIMALPDNFSALFQQEQRDPEYIIDNRRSITSFLNHPNTKSMANAARASAGPGGGSSMGIYPSALLLQESSVVTAEPVVDSKTSPPTMYETSVTKSPLMIVDPFKPSAGLEGLPASASDIINTKCSYLQVSMPTQFSGLVTNTGATPSEGPTTTFEFKRRDGSVVNYRKLTPTVLCSDASFNLMDEFSRADTTLNDMEIRFGFMPEILEAIAKFKGLEVSDVIKSMNAKTTSNGNNGANTTVDRTTGDVITVKNGVAFPTHAVESASSTSNEWGVNGIMQGRSLPSFLFNNPSGAASVNGVPITREGELLAAIKRGRAAGKGDVSEEEFGKGVLSEGALRAVGDKTLSSDLKPLKEGWDRLVKLQKVFTTSANNLRESVESKTAIKDAEVAKGLAQSIVNNFKILKECKNFIRDMTSRIVASSDLVTGGYGGDPSMALVAPYRSENMGVIGAVSGGINMGIGGLMASKSRGIEALRTAMEERVTLSSKRGREMPEHSGIRYDDGEELISDADSLFRGVVNKSPSSSSLLHKVVENLVQGLETGDRLRQRAFEDVKPSMDSEENKRHAITKLLSENHDLLTAIANTMYFGSDHDGSTSINRRGVDIIDETKYQQRIKFDAANKDGLNALFNTK